MFSKRCANQRNLAADLVGSVASQTLSAYPK